MKLSETTLTGVLNAFRAPTPTPGGGSAAALAGALGASLLAMVAGLPKPRTATEADIQRLRDALSLCSDYARRLEALVDQDADAYLAVVSAYRLPKESDADKQARSARIQEAMKLATDTPLETMRLCWSALAEADAVSELGNASAASGGAARRPAQCRDQSRRAARPGVRRPHPRGSRGAVALRFSGSGGAAAPSGCW
jgi:formiminotetrahydrofolate cyclodeaminase